MKEASRTVSGGNLPSFIKTILPAVIVPPAIRFVAETFVSLQDGRHRADYDVAVQYRSRQDALEVIDEAADAFEQWQAVLDDAARQLYLTSLLVWDQWKGK